MTADTELTRPTPPVPKPRIALFFSTVCSLGYMPFAPGTFGSLAGIGIYWLVVHFRLHDSFTNPIVYRARGVPMAEMPWELLCWLNLFVACIGLASAENVSKKTGIKDPQFIVIDETSGQMLTYSLAFAPLNWKYLLLGFILFRLFDIWKPFPARQAESLPGGWGIMADDWIAGLYAALGLWIARAAGF
jgi:phosphatidylglycerophosphatase A